MKVIHFADLHLGVENYGHLNAATGLSSRLEDFLRAFDEVVDYALHNRADLVLFCGDAYKSREPTPTQQREFAKRVNRLASDGVAVFLLVGNHDLPNAVGKATATEIFDTLAIKNVYVSSRPDVYRVETRSGPVQVASLPWPRRGLLLSKDETKELDFNQIKQKLEEALTRIVENHASRLDNAIPSVLAAHVWVTGATTGTEKMITIGQDHAMLVSNIGNASFDYVALGHIHKRQILSSRPPVVYSGSIERLDFSEEEDEKGFYVIDIHPDHGTDREVDFTFHEVNARRFVTIKVSVEAEDISPTRTILAELERHSEEIRDAIVRVLLSMPAAVQTLINDGELRDALKDAYHCTISREIKDEIRVRLGGVTAGELTPLEALKTWLETKKLPEERVRVLLQFGERLMGEGG